MDDSQSSIMDVPAPYRIRVYGSASERWLSGSWDMTAMTFQRGAGMTTTEMVGKVTDQAALVGLINMLYDLGYVIISVERLTADQMVEIIEEQANL
jgi:hypothetical protein